MSKWKVTLNPARTRPHKSGDIVFKPGEAQTFDELPEAVKAHAAIAPSLFVIEESGKKSKSKDEPDAKG